MENSLMVVKFDNNCRMFGVNIRTFVVPIKAVAECAISLTSKY